MPQWENGLQSNIKIDNLLLLEEKVEVAEADMLSPKQKGSTSLCNQIYFLDFPECFCLQTRLVKFKHQHLVVFKQRSREASPLFFLFIGESPTLSNIRWFTEKSTPILKGSRFYMGLFVWPPKFPQCLVALTPSSTMI